VGIASIKKSLRVEPKAARSLKRRFVGERARRRTVAVDAVRACAERDRMR
jgi:hypothetical protein